MTEEVQRRVISEFMVRNNVQADAEKERNGCWRAIWNNPSPPSASIVIYHHNDRSALLRCIRSILTKTNYPKFDVNAVVCDRSWARALDKRVRAIQSEKASGFAQACNLGAAESKGDVIIFVDAHVEVASPNWVEELVGWASQPSIGAAGPKLMFPDSKHIAHCGIVIGLSTFLFYGATDGTWSPLYQEHVSQRGEASSTEPVASTRTYAPQRTLNIA
jgi:GT2 family glycosyltransferase